MSIARMVYVVCDGCGNPCGSVDDMRDDQFQARDRAKELGWIFKRFDYRTEHKNEAVSMGFKKKDLCLECQ